MYIKVSLIVWIDDIEQDKPSEVVIDGKHDKDPTEFANKLGRLL